MYFNANKSSLGKLLNYLRGALPHAKTNLHDNAISVRKDLLGIENLILRFDAEFRPMCINRRSLRISDASPAYLVGANCWAFHVSSLS